jgi:hypothetical protein
MIRGEVLFTPFWRSEMFESKKYDSETKLFCGCLAITIISLVTIAIKERYEAIHAPMVQFWGPTRADVQMSEFLYPRSESLPWRLSVKYLEIIRKYDRLYPVPNPEKIKDLMRTYWRERELDGLPEDPSVELIKQEFDVILARYK